MEERRGQVAGQEAMYDRQSKIAQYTGWCARKRIKFASNLQCIPSPKQCLDCQQEQ
jgi:hypothetical protein